MSPNAIFRCYMRGRFGKQMTNSHFNYDAFLSYSSLDISLVSRLQSNIEALGPALNRQVKLFMDRTDMGTRGIWKELDAALESSKSFILCASPAAAKSDYVKEELRRFSENYPDREIFVALISGDEKCVPDKLSTIKYSDLRRSLSILPRINKQDELLRLCAAIYDKPLRTLIPWAKRRRITFIARLFFALLVPIIFLGGYVWIQRNQLNQREAEQQIDRAYTAAEGGEDTSLVLKHLYSGYSLSKDRRHEHSLAYLTRKLLPLNEWSNDHRFIINNNSTYLLQFPPLKIANFEAATIFEIPEDMVISISTSGEITLASKNGSSLEEFIAKNYRPSFLTYDNITVCRDPNHQSIYRLLMPMRDADPMTIWIDVKDRKIFDSRPLGVSLDVDAACEHEIASESTSRLSEAQVSPIVVTVSESGMYDKEPKLKLPVQRASWDTAQKLMGGLIELTINTSTTKESNAMEWPRIEVPTSIANILKPLDEIMQFDCEDSGRKSIAILRPAEYQYATMLIPYVDIKSKTHESIAIGNRFGSPVVLARNCKHFVDLANAELFSAGQGEKPEHIIKSLGSRISQIAFSSDSTTIVVTTPNGFAYRYAFDAQKNVWNELDSFEVATIFPLPEPRKDAFGVGIPFQESFQDPISLQRLGNLAIDESGNVLYVDQVGRLLYQPVKSAGSWRTTGPVIRQNEILRGFEIQGKYVYLWASSSIIIFSKDNGLLIDRLSSCDCESGESKFDCHLRKDQGSITAICQTQHYRMEGPELSFQDIDKNTIDKRLWPTADNNVSWPHRSLSTR